MPTDTEREGGLKDDKAKPPPPDPKEPADVETGEDADDDGGMIGEG